MNAPNFPSADIRRVPLLDPEIAAALEPYFWPLDRLGEAVEALSLRCGLTRGGLNEPLVTPPSLAAAEPAAIADWFDWAADRLGVEAVSVNTTVTNVPNFLNWAGPAIIMNNAAGTKGFFVLLGKKWGKPHLLAADLTTGTCVREHLRTAMCWHPEEDLRPEIETVLKTAHIAPSRFDTVKRAMMRERLLATWIDSIWILRLSASTGFWRQLVNAGVIKKIMLMLAIFAFLYVLEIAGWALIGSAALGGRLDLGWFAAWFLLVITMVPWRVAGSWYNAAFALDAGRLLKSRLLAGALNMNVGTVKQQGIGHLLGRVMESQALESLALNGGVAVLIALMELMFAAWILSQGAAAGPHLILLMIWTGLAAWLCWRYYGRLYSWTHGRLGMTHDLIEAMVGHRTRLAQERPGRRDAHDDTSLQNYLASSKSLDGAGMLVSSTLSSGWILIGLIGLLPTFTRDAAVSPTSIAITLGGMLLAQRAFGGVAGGLAALSRAVIAWRQVSELFRTARPRRASQTYTVIGAGRDGGTTQARLIDAQGLSFQYNAKSDIVLKDVNLAINHGDRILLQGASGGGKSTLAALIAGLQTSDTGLLLLNGLDRHTLGDDWQRLAATVPQFHENYVLSGTVAFNILMGRQWPASEALLKEATELCEELGLGDLLRRMPAGINQRVGETGWQLSHGERSRIFLARALMQRAQLIIMDESFGALDPETLDLCLQTVLKRAKTLIVIAHP
jgi:ATP-binding cassette, subfamily B, bacterial